MQALSLRILTLTLFLCPLLPRLANADDGHAATSAGGIVFEKTDSISMDQEFLEISKDKVKVRFHFKNLTKAPIKTLVAFPLPPLTCGYWGENKTVSDFSVKVNGKTVHPIRELKAVENASGGEKPVPFGTGKDISARVKAAGLSLDCMKTWNNKLMFKKAQRNKLAEDYKGTDPEGVTYQTEITYHWEQVFPPGEIVQIEHEYKPMAGIGLGYCPYDDAKLKFRLPVRTGEADCNLIDYVLRTAKTWSGPIRHFELAVPLTPKDTAIWSNIGPMTLNQEKTRATFTQDSFVPADDLVIGIWQER